MRKKAHLFNRGTVTATYRERCYRRIHTRGLAEATEPQKDIRTPVLQCSISEPQSPSALLYRLILIFNQLFNMRFSTLLAATTIAVSSAVASPQLLGRDVLGFDLSVGNYYGAPNAPWVPGASPGWYNGQYPWLYPELPCLVGGVSIWL